jgi:hypothetical protein
MQRCFHDRSVKVNFDRQTALIIGETHFEMRENQYQLFRDLDRHCVAGGFKYSDCAEIVERKKQSIDSTVIQENPVVREILKGERTFVGFYDSFSRSYRGLRRFVPHAHNDDLNTRIEYFSRIVPNVAHFRRRSVFAADNPISCSLYGVIAGLAAGFVWAQSIHDIGGSAVTGDSAAYYYLGVIFGFGGFVVGSVSMIRYHTWDPRQIHAHEAAIYMDLNYEFYRNRDDEGWAHFIRTAGDAQRLANQPGK